MAKTKVAILFGGKSGEHEVSIVSAMGIFSALDKDKYDVVSDVTSQSQNSSSSVNSQRLIISQSRSLEIFPGFILVGIISASVIWH